MILQDINFQLFFILFFVLTIFFFLLHRYFLKTLKNISSKSKNKIDDVLILILSSFSIHFYIFLSFIVAAIYSSELPQNIQAILFSIAVAWLAYRFSGVVNECMKTLFCENEKSSIKQLITFFASFAKIIIWIIALLVILSLNGVKITTLLASLGIGGLAVAFASQKILSDLFSAFVIFFDKPFGVGDYIIVDQKDGVVEHIGIKTTRIRSLAGELIIIPNEEMTSAIIQNYKSVSERRSVINIGVLYETEKEKLKKVTDIMSKTVLKNSKCRLDRATLKEFASSSVNYELVFFAKVSSYKEFLITNEEILFDIFDQFSSEGIEFAYPTQTLYIKK